MATVALFGAGGFVGRHLLAALNATEKYEITPVTRATYADHIGKFYHIIINAAMPSGRFWAKQNPEKDFEETVKKTASILHNCTCDKFVQISTVSARCQLDTIYGRHKRAAEILCHYGENLIIRLSAMFGDDLTKGVLIDMLKGQKVFMSGESRYSFADVDFCAKYIAAHLDKTGIVEVGARNSIRLQDIANHLNKKIEFEGPPDVQEIENPDSEFPDAKEVLPFLDRMKSKF